MSQLVKVSNREYQIDNLRVLKRGAKERRHEPGHRWQVVGPDGRRRALCIDLAGVRGWLRDMYDARTSSPPPI